MSWIQPFGPWKDHQTGQSYLKHRGHSKTWALKYTLVTLLYSIPIFRRRNMGKLKEKFQIGEISKQDVSVQNQGLFWATDCLMRGALEVAKSKKANVGKSKCGLFGVGGWGVRGTVRGGGLACRGQGAHILPPILPHITYIWTYSHFLKLSRHNAYDPPTASFGNDKIMDLRFLNVRST